jgi:hypothetical protein
VFGIGSRNLAIRHEYRPRVALGLCKHCWFPHIAAIDAFADCARHGRFLLARLCHYQVHKCQHPPWTSSVRSTPTPLGGRPGRRVLVRPATIWLFGLTWLRHVAFCRMSWPWGSPDGMDLLPPLVLETLFTCIITPKPLPNLQRPLANPSVGPPRER